MYFLLYNIFTVTKLQKWEVIHKDMQFPEAAVKDHHIFGSLKQQKCILLQFWKPEFWNHYDGTKLKRLAGPHSLWRLQEKLLSCPLPVSGGYWLSFTCGHIYSSSQSQRLHISLLHIHIDSHSVCFIYPSISLLWRYMWLHWGSIWIISPSQDPSLNHTCEDHPRPFLQ